MLRRPLAAIAIGFGLAVLFAGWLLLAPATLGGQLQYIITSGSSMEPSFKDGDLALLRTQNNYARGDIVAYEHPELGLILHRIVGIDGATFIVKGDSNPTEDAYRPTSEEIAGEAWIHVPDAGRVINGIAGHHWTVLAGGVLGALLLIPVGIVFPAGSQRRNMRIPDISTRIEPERVVFLLGPAGQLLIVALAFLSVAGLALAFTAFNRDLERQVVVPITYEQQADLSYSATADGSVYSQNVVSSGDPVYRAVVDELSIRLDYDLTSERPASGNGSYWINAEIESSDGWQQTILLRDRTPFSGSTLSDMVILPLTQVDQIIEEFQTQTGLDSPTGIEFIVRVLAAISFDGAISNEVVHTFADADLAFIWDPAALYPEATESNDDITDTGGVVDTSRIVTNTINLGATTVSVRTARMLAQILLFIAIAGGVILWLLMRKALQASEAAQITARYRSRIVPIQGVNMPAPVRVVALLSFDDLMRIADQKQEPILYFTKNQVHYYYVQATDVIYRVRIEPDKPLKPLAVPSEYDASP